MRKVGLYGVYDISDKNKTLLDSILDYYRLQLGGEEITYDVINYSPGNNGFIAFVEVTQPFMHKKIINITYTKEAYYVDIYNKSGFLVETEEDIRCQKKKEI